MSQIWKTLWDQAKRKEKKISAGALDNQDNLDAAMQTVP